MYIDIIDQICKAIKQVSTVHTDLLTCNVNTYQNFRQLYHTLQISC